jgi:hypothetical protein
MKTTSGLLIAVAAFVINPCTVSLAHAQAGQVSTPVRSTSSHFCIVAQRRHPDPGLSVPAHSDQLFRLIPISGSD